MLSKPFSRLAGVILSAAAMFHYGTQTASAQSLFGSGQTAGQTGRPQAGSSSFGGANLTRSNTPASGFTSSFGGSNQIGQSTGLNTSGLSQTTTTTGPQIATELGELSATIGQGGFVGRSDTAGRFVGNVMAGQQTLQGTNVGGQFGGGQFGGRGQFSGGQFGQGGQGFNQQGFNQQSRRVVRPQLRLAFEFSQPAATEVQTSLSTQFQRLESSRPELDNVQIQFGTDRVAVLRGEVASENDKKLAAMVARMEPGVRTVRNELTVRGN